MRPSGKALIPAAVAFAVCAALSRDPAPAAEIPTDERRSDFDLMTPEIQAMQRDDFANPGMLWVAEGEALWSGKAGAAERACADCHGAAPISMRGVAARYPAFDEKDARPVDLEGRINLCRERHQRAPALAYESKELLALTAYVARQSRGMPITPVQDARMEPFLARGKSLFETRQGQLNFSCSQCHDDNWGKRLGGSMIPQAHPTGYPVYRLEWQELGSLQRRFRGCLVGVRAEPYAYGSPEYVALTLYLMWRARGMAAETPAVRP